MLNKLSFTRSALVVLTLFAGEQWSRAGVIYDSESRPTSITDLEIGDATYRVDIEYGGSFDDHFGDFAAPSPLPLYWGSESGATDAVTAIAAALNAETPRPTTSTLLLVPTGSGTWPFGDYVDAKIADFTPGSTDYTHSTSLDGVRLDPHVGASNFWLDDVSRRAGTVDVLPHVVERRLPRREAASSSPRYLIQTQLRSKAPVRAVEALAGVVEFEDLNDVRDHFGETVLNAVVPKPSVLPLLSIADVASCAHRFVSRRCSAI